MDVIETNINLECGKKFIGIGHPLMVGEILIEEFGLFVLSDGSPLPNFLFKYVSDCG